MLMALQKPHRSANCGARVCAGLTGLRADAGVAALRRERDIQRARAKERDPAELLQ